MTERWPDPPERLPERSLERPRRGGGDPLEQGLDRLVSAGRQLVDGVSGARPGARAAAGRAPGRGGGERPPLANLGRWVEDKLDWILEDDDDWREPWQQDQPPEPGPGRTRRRPLDAISRRTRPAAAAPPTAAPAAEGPADAWPDAWPDDASFSRPRWQRRTEPAAPASPPPARRSDPGGGRPLPRSSRRRPL